MSETQESTTPAPEPAYRDPVNRSDVGSEAPLIHGDAPEPAEEKAPEPEPKTEEAPKEAKSTREHWAETRVRQLNAKVAAASQRAEALEQELAAVRAAVPKNGTETPTEAPKGQSQSDFDKAVAARAEVVAHEQAFNARCNEVAEAGNKEFPDFGAAIGKLWEATEGFTPQGGFKPQSVALLEAALDMDQPHAVLRYLGQNPEEAIRISEMKSDARRGAAIAKIAAKLTEAPPKPDPKPISRAPSPVEPIAGGGSTAEDGLNSKDLNKWMSARDKQAKANGYH